MQRPHSLFDQLPRRTRRHSTQQDAFWGVFWGVGGLEGGPIYRKFPNKISMLIFLCGNFEMKSKICGCGGMDQC